MIVYRDGYWFLVAPAVLERNDGERMKLERWTRRQHTTQRLVSRSAIVLECAGGTSNREVAARLGVSAPTVGKWWRTNS